MGRHRAVYERHRIQAATLGLAFLVACSLSATIGTVTAAVSEGEMPTPRSQVMEASLPSRTPGAWMRD